MRINNISTTNFDGKAKYLRGIKGSEKDFAQKILDFKVNGTSNREFLEGKNFNIGFYDSKKNPSSDTLFLSVPIRYLQECGSKIHGFEDRQVHEINILSGVEAGANALRRVIEKIDGDIATRYPAQYNSWGQKIKLKRNM